MSRYRYSVRHRVGYNNPVVTFITRRGNFFVKTFSSRDAAVRAIRGWKRKGGRVHRVKSTGGL